MRVLTRTVLRQVLVTQLVFAAIFIAVISAVISAPVLAKGAPLEAVLATWPHQVVFALPLCLPVGLIAGLLGMITRLQHTGELNALRSAGIAPGAVIRCIWPLVLVTGLLIGLVNQVFLPQTMLHLLASKKELIQQGLAAKVARKQPLLVKDHGARTLAARSLADNRLVDLFGLAIDDDRTVIAYAPSARWVFDDDLALQSEELRVLSIDTDLRQTAVVSPSASAVLAKGVVQHLPMKDMRERVAEKPETMTWRQLREAGPRLQRQWQAAFAEGRHKGNINRSYRKWQLQRHQRWYQAVAVVGQCLLAAAIALRLPVANPALNAVLALLVVLGISMPGQLVISGASKTLSWHPAWAMWPVLAIAAALGAFLIRRWR